jgi:outer membrane lipoprotein SlyB
MKTLTQSLTVILLGASLGLSLTACKNEEPAKAAEAPKCYDCGTISKVQKMTDEGKSSGLGIVLGAVAGAVVGHQVGDGKGQDAATVVGAVGGGIAGNEIEKHVKGTPYFHVTVQMDNGGGSRTVNVGSMNGLGNGSRVRIVGNNLQTVG